jgi:hypothetical protein
MIFPGTVTKTTIPKRIAKEIKIRILDHQGAAIVLLLLASNYRI